ncbi:MAG: hypothetical protein Q8P82_01235 [bacterium]|nr:hypothetical protein [bacterium]
MRRRRQCPQNSERRFAMDAGKRSPKTITSAQTAAHRQQVKFDRISANAARSLGKEIASALRAEKAYNREPFASRFFLFLAYTFQLLAFRLLRHCERSDSGARQSPAHAGTTDF